MSNNWPSLRLLMSEAADESVFQTPDSIIIRPPQPDHEELEPAVPDNLQDVGASPDLGPRTRSGKKRKNPAPVKSTGKKKNKMFRSPSAPTSAPPTATPDTVLEMVPPTPTTPAPPVGVVCTPTVVPPGGALGAAAATAVGPPATANGDLAALLTSGLGDIKASMGGMEQRLAGKIDALEGSVKINERHIQVLTSSVNCHSEELASLA